MMEGLKVLATQSEQAEAKRRSRAAMESVMSTTAAALAAPAVMLPYLQAGTLMCAAAP